MSEALNVRATKDMQIIAATRPSTLIQLHVVAVQHADPVCRCGHGFSVHRLHGDQAARDCEACAAVVAAGSTPPAGSCCHAFVE